MLADHLTRIVKEHQVDCVIANAENAAGGSGLTPQIYTKLLKYGVNLVTLGDHTYRKRDIIETLDNSDCLVRPANLSAQAAGKTWAAYTTSNGVNVAVVTLLGRLYMNLPSDNPFATIDRMLSGVIPKDINIVVVEMHAEASSEKIAMGWSLDGRVSAVIGTHTHVTTADETVLPGGTAYITDLGMTGPHRSVLGRSIDPVVKSLTTQMPYAYGIATEDLRINGVLIGVDSASGRASDITRICVKDPGHDQQAYDGDDGKPNHTDHSVL